MIYLQLKQCYVGHCWEGEQAPSCMPEALGLIPDPRGGRGMGKAGEEEGGEGKEQEGKARRNV